MQLGGSDPLAGRYGNQQWNRAIVQGDVNRAGIPHVDGIFVGDRVVLLTSAYYDARVIDLFGSRVRVAYQAGTVWATPWDRKASRGTRRLVSARK